MKIKGKEIKIIGHRGAPALGPENTLLGFQKALNLGCEMIETDVRLSRDNEIVLIHDKTLNRTTNGEGLVSQKTLEELKKLNAGKGEKIPTLEETWDLIKEKAELNIEIKDKKALEPILEFIKKENIERKVLISSRYFWVLEKIKKTNSLFRIGLILYFPIFPIWQAKKTEAESIHSLNLITTSVLVKKCRQNNLKIYPFPIGTKRENPQKIKKLIEAGIDGIFLNDPNIMKEIT